MAGEFVDSFDHYGTSLMSEKWTASGGTIVVGGRHGYGLSNPGIAALTLTPQSKRIIGIAINTNTLGTQGMLRLVGDITVSLGGLGDGRLRIVLGDPATGTTLAVSDGPVYSTNRWR